MVAVEVEAAADTGPRVAAVPAVVLAVESAAALGAAPGAVSAAA